MPSTEEVLIEAAAQLTDAAAGELVVIVVRGSVEIVRPEALPIQPAVGLSAYDAAIVEAAGDRPMSAKRLAHAAGHRHNSYFRKRLARLVESGLLRATRRGYSRPAV